MGELESSADAHSVGGCDDVTTTRQAQRFCDQNLHNDFYLPQYHHSRRHDDRLDRSTGFLNDRSHCLVFHHNFVINKYFHTLNSGDSQHRHRREASKRSSRSSFGHTRGVADFANRSVQDHLHVSHAQQRSSRREERSWQ